MTVSDLCISKPSRINSNGVDMYLRIDQSEQEQKLHRISASILKKIIKTIDL